MIAAGVDQDNTSGVVSSSFYIFSASSGLLIRTTLNPTPDTNDRFGVSVAASGCRRWCDGRQYSGAAVRTGLSVRIDSSASIRTISNPSPLQYQNFGFSVSISGNVLVIGNRLFDLPDSGTGQSYAYDLRNGALTTTLKNPTSANSDFFGQAVAISGNKLVVGAPYDDTQNTDQGAAYLYELSSQPTDLEISTSYIQENNAANTVVGTLTSY